MGNLIQSGRFTSDGNSKTLQIRSDIDFLEVINFTNAGATGDDGVKFIWQRGLADGAAIYEFKSGGGNNLNLGTLTSGGFTLVDSSANPLGSSVAITAATDVVRPIVSTANTGDLVAGDIVRLDSVTGSLGLAGIDFTVDTIVANTSFRLAGAMANSQGSAGTAGNYRKVKFDPLYYPRHRSILNITQAASAVVTLSVPSGYKVGQKVRFSVPESEYGMVEMDGLLGTVTAVDDTTATQSITVNIDSSGFTAFAFPTSAQAASPLSQAMVMPVGMDTAQAQSSSVDQLSDATDNVGYIGMLLGAGASAPAGASNDVMYWRAYKSELVNNE
jgi:hypothetical protein